MRENTISNSNTLQLNTTSLQQLSVFITKNNLLNLHNQALSHTH
uniref:Uncharacterized protein n=1 Tax=Arundo donax TaxID=35708 RepID=A0A0A9FH82_ARUDO